MAGLRRHFYPTQTYNQVCQSEPEISVGSDRREKGAVTGTNPVLFLLAGYRVNHLCGAIFSAFEQVQRTHLRSKSEG